MGYDQKEEMGVGPEEERNTLTALESRNSFRVSVPQQPSFTF